MTEFELETEKPEAVSLSPRGRRRRLPPGLGILLEVAAASIPVAGTVWIVGYLGRESKLDIWICLAIAGCGAILASCWGALVRRRFWSRPARSLLTAVDRARQGELPIEELSRIRGHMEPLAVVLQELLQLQQTQKSQLQEMEQEVRGRIASRTNALERKIGSLRLQAMRDSLTGLFNRRSMEQEIPRLLTEHQTDRRDACLLMIDVDHFKSLNDTLGHVAGDHLLKQIGQIIRSTIRDNDMAFRCGGDEFVILLYDTSFDAGRDVSRRLESLVDALARPLHLPQSPRLSIGVCALSELEVPSAQAWLEIADKRLYAIKSARQTHRKSVAFQPVKKSA